MTWEDIAYIVNLRIGKWAIVRKVFSDLKIDNILNNWGASVLIKNEEESLLVFSYGRSLEV